MLLYMEEEETFWMFCALIEDILPPLYYSGTLLGVHADQLVLSQLIAEHLPDLSQVLKHYEVGMSKCCSYSFTACV